MCQIILRKIWTIKLIKIAESCMCIKKAPPEQGYYRMNIYILLEVVYTLAGNTFQVNLDSRYYSI